MNGPTETKDVEINLAPLANARVAYTLNNYQPVRSSFIGAEPMFFMDTDEIIEEESMFDEFTSEFLMQEMENAKKKMESYDALSKDFQIEGDQAVAEAFDENAKCLEAESSAESTLEDIFEMLKQSRFADTLIDYVQAHGIDIVHSASVPTSEYDRNAQKIFVNPSLDVTYQVLLISSELRRVWQHKNGALVDPMAFYPDHGILLNRLQEADRNAFMIRIAWELKLADHTEVWSFIENSQFADLGRAFAREACTDFRAANNGKALLSIVEAWFLSERCRKHDRTLIQRMLAGKAPEGFAHSQDLSRQALIEAIYALGKNPYGNNYLSAHIPLLTEDPIFSEVRDRSNANFLWFVKFESSFAQAEQELQLSESSGASASIDTQGTNNEAEIISFPNQSGSRNQSANKQTQSGNGAIIQFSGHAE